MALASLFFSFELSETFNFFRPAAEGQEANGQESFNGNGNHHAPSDDIKNTEQENPWQQKYLAISQEHEQM